MGDVFDQDFVDLAGDVALEPAKDVEVGLAIGGALLDVGTGAFAAGQPVDRDHVQRAVRVAVTALVEPVPVDVFP